MRTVNLILSSVDQTSAVFRFSALIWHPAMSHTFARPRKLRRSDRSFCLIGAIFLFNLLPLVCKFEQSELQTEILLCFLCPKTDAPLPRKSKHTHTHTHTHNSRPHRQNAQDFAGNGTVIDGRHVVAKSVSKDSPPSWAVAAARHKNSPYVKRTAQRFAMVPFPFWICSALSFRLELVIREHSTCPHTQACASHTKCQL